MESLCPTKNRSNSITLQKKMFIKSHDFSELAKNYTLVRQLGAGAFSKVILAVHHLTGQ